MPDVLLDRILTQAWALSPSVALRPEPFGALAYHFGNRKLTFLKRPELVQVVRVVAEHPDVRAARGAAGVPESQHAADGAALRGLAPPDQFRPRQP
ncbi:mycofactocin biosynthesis chaperone MftB, partial [Nocardioides sp.]|uniref:mycofactocin biosynthesis chaperone MftB n=1 Tax=Nocardioides sp. TaxID=35761 RepID=UPI003219CB76